MSVNHLLPMSVRSTVLAVVEGIALATSMGIVSAHYRGGGMEGGREREREGGDNLKHTKVIVLYVCSQEHQ